MLLAEDVMSCVLETEELDDDTELDSEDSDVVLSEVVDKLVCEETLD